MAEISIDQSKLPGVKEVCRDFAVLEDHTLAHSLQEQEIEHHLATNVQRNRLVQHDLQMAKQLQEEEDRKARARHQEQHKDIERQDCEIAQEIQVKLVIEAEQRRRQEEDDEDIARILQQKELQEEKRRKKPPPEVVRPSPYEEGYYLESRDRQPGSPTGRPSEPSRSGSADRPPRQPRDDPRGPPFVSEGLELEVLGSSSDVKKARDGRRHPREAQREKKPGSREKPWKDADDGLLEGGNSRTRVSREGKVHSASAERLWEPSPPRREAGHGSRERQERRPRSRQRPPRAPPLVDWEVVEGASLAHDRHRKCREGRSPGSEKSLKPTDGNAEDQEEKRSRRRHSHSPRPDRLRLPPHEDGQSSRPSSHDRRRRDPDTPPQRGPRRPVEREGERGRDGTPTLSASRYGESLELDARRRRHPGTKPRGTKEAAYSKPRGVPAQDQELYDAEIAQKLQEEELLASQVDKRAAQVAQDEEIARLLMAEEKAAYKKAREKEKSFAEKKRQDPGWKHDTPESVPPRSREGHEPHRGRSDKPTRPPPPPTEDLDHLVNLTSQQNSAYQIPKPESSQKGAGYHYKP